MKNKLQSADTQRFKRKALTAIISSTMFSLPAAQAAVMLEEVIVTSTKNMENLQDVPQAITAFTTADIDKEGFVGLDEYAKKIPSLAFSRSEPGGTSIIFRGIATSAITAGTKSSSSIYLDEQPITSAASNTNPRMVDIERLEALSGPQGTLFGDSSQSGALRIITNKADPSGFSAWVEGELGYVEHGEAEGGISAMVNIPINDSLAIRLVGFSYEEAGYIDNVLQDSPGGLVNPGGTFDNRDNVKDDINSATESGARAALHWDINDDWLMDSIVIYQKRDTDGFGDVNIDVGDLEQVRYNDETAEDEWYQLGLTLEGDLGFATSVVSLAYFERENFYETDSTDYLTDFQNFSDEFQAYFNSNYPSYATDFLFYDFGSIANYGPNDYSGDPRATATNESEEDRLSIEARLQFEGEDSDWDAIVGVFYNKTDSHTLFRGKIENYQDTKAAFYLNNFACADPDPGNPYLCRNHSLNGLPAGSFGGDTEDFFFGVYDSQVEDKAIFGEANYDLTEDFTVTVGGRWYENKFDRKYFTGALSPANRDPSRALDYVNNDGELSDKDDGFVGKFGVRYNIDYDKMVFATYSEGFRSGGGNLLKPVSVLPSSYDADFLINHEVGFKSSWMNNRLRVNVVAYRMVWEDIQLFVDDPQVNVFSTGVINFAEAEVNGVETEIVFAVTEGLELSLTHAYLDAEISEDDIAFPEFDDSVQVSKGTRLPGSPDQKGSLGLEYNFQGQWFGMDPYVKFDYSYVGNSVTSIEGLTASAQDLNAVEQDSYETMDIAVGMANDDWAVSLKLENLEDERAQQYYNNRMGSTPRISINKPRNLTLTVRRSF